MVVFYVWIIMCVSVSYPEDLTEPLLHQLCVQLLDLLLVTDIGSQLYAKTWRDNVKHIR